jgi:hypothetical protein
MKLRFNSWGDLVANRHVLLYVAMIYFSTHIEYLLELEGRLSDSAFGYARRAFHPRNSCPKLVVVQMDDAILDEAIGAGKAEKRYPFPRRVLAEVITNLCELKPKVLVVDFDLRGTATPEDDLALKQALLGLGNSLFMPLVNSNSFADLGILAPVQFESDADGIHRTVCKRVSMGSQLPRYHLCALVAERMGASLSAVRTKARLDFRLPPERMFTVISGLAFHPSFWTNTSNYLSTKITSESAVILAGFNRENWDRFLVPGGLGNRQQPQDAGMVDDQDDNLIRGGFLLAYGIDALYRSHGHLPLWLNNLLWVAGVALITFLLTVAGDRGLVLAGVGLCVINKVLFLTLFFGVWPEYSTFWRLCIAAGTILLAIIDAACLIALGMGRRKANLITPTEFTIADLVLNGLLWVRNYSVMYTKWSGGGKPSPPSIIWVWALTLGALASNLVMILSIFRASVRSPSHWILFLLLLIFGGGRSSVGGKKESMGSRGVSQPNCGLPCSSLVIVSW